MIADTERQFADLTDCRRWQSGISGDNTRLQRAAELELHALLLRLTEQVGGLHQTSIATGIALDGSLAVSKMAAYIALNYQEPCSIRQIAAATGLHPNYAMNLFRKNTGMTLHAYLEQHRLFHARRRLVTANDTILNVALDSGFGSASRFYEIFNQSVGCSPGEYRKKISSGNPSL